MRASKDYRRRSGAAILLTGLLVSGCNAAAPQIPAELLTPPERPAIPAPGSSDNAIARYILSMEEWSEVVIRRFEAVAEIVR